MTETMAESGRYLYAISRAVDSASLEDTPGIRGSRLEVVAHRSLSAVVSTVDLTEFGEAGLRRNLEDLEWLEDVARSHDAVIQKVATLGPTAPLRLATICLDDLGVRARLDEWYHPLQQVLDRVEGRLEWSVKAYARQGTDDEQVAAGVATEQGMGSGAAYLARKREQTQQRQEAEERALQVAEQIHTRLSEHAVASRRLPAQDPRLTGHEGVMTLNGAYLVPAEGGESFAAALASLREEQPEAHLDARGPWPPYSFAMLEQR